MQIAWEFLLNGSKILENFWFDANHRFEFVVQIRVHSTHIGTIRRNYLSPAHRIWVQKIIK